MNRRTSNNNLIASCWTFLVAMVFASAAIADDRTTMEQLLTQPPAPSGVVFEIAQGQESALEWALPEARRNAERLRAAFPDIKLAVVTHGKEEFALLTANADKYKDVHNQVKSLTQNQDIPIHVCGTHASWYEKQPEDFPSYVNVAPAGPAQINDYRALGYAVVRIRKPGP